MAVYKVPQDVEADDKLIGPFSLRQFIFLLSMVGFMYIAFLLSKANILLAGIPLPIIIFLAALAFPWKKDQPTEVYLTALIHFWILPRKRIWNQEGHIEHVRITVPKKTEHRFTDGMNRGQVKSRLKNLALTIDSRGWASRNVASPSAVLQNGLLNQQVNSDRLINQPLAAPPTDNVVTTIDDDVMDYQNNPVAQNFSNLVSQTEQNRKAQLIQQMQTASNPQQTPPAPVAVAAAPVQNETTPQTAMPTPSPVAVATPIPTQPLPTQDNSSPYPQMQQRVVAPTTDNQSPVEELLAKQKEAVDTEANNAIIGLASNSDLSVDTIARQAEQAMNSGDTIELH